MLLPPESVDGVIKRVLEVVVHFLKAVDLRLLHQLGGDVVSNRVKQEILEQPGAAAFIVNEIGAKVLE